MSLTLGSTSPPLASQPDWQQPRGLRLYHLTIIPYYDAARRRRSSFNYQFVSMYINDNINRKDTSNSFNYRNKCSFNLRVGPAVMALVTRPSPSVRCSYRKTEISMIGLHQQKWSTHDWPMGNEFSVFATHSLIAVRLPKESWTRRCTTSLSIEASRISQYCFFHFCYLFAVIITYRVPSSGGGGSRNECFILLMVISSLRYKVYSGYGIIG